LKRHKEARSWESVHAESLEKTCVMDSSTTYYGRNTRGVSQILHSQCHWFGHPKNPKMRGSISGRIHRLPHTRELVEASEQNPRATSDDIVHGKQLDACPVLGLGMRLLFMTMYIWSALSRSGSTTEGIIPHLKQLLNAKCFPQSLRTFRSGDPKLWRFTEYSRRHQSNLLWCR
jgi:hypothetical protein